MGNNSIQKTATLKMTNSDFTSTYVLSLNNIEINGAVDTVTEKYFGSAGLKNYSDSGASTFTMSASGLYDHSVGLGLTTLAAAYYKGVIEIVYMDNANSKKVTYAANVIITSMKVECSVGQVAKVSFEFEGDSLTETAGVIA